MQLLLIGYAGVAVFCLQAVNCINIDGVSCLYLQASVSCYQFWQYVILGFIFVWVVPFPIALYIGCRLLRENKIKGNSFLFMITFPPITQYQAVKLFREVFIDGSPQIRLSSDEITTFEHELETDHILGIINKPFQVQQNNPGLPALNHQLIWEPMLIARRLVLVAVSTYIIPPMEKLYPVAVLLLVFMLHDIFMRPYTNDQLNAIQLISMQLLCLLTFVNLFWTFSNDIDISPDQSPQYYQLGKVFLYLEILILLLPIIILFWLMILKFGRFLYKVCSQKQD